jgi:hypothetical protein
VKKPVLYYALNVSSLAQPQILDMTKSLIYGRFVLFLFGGVMHRSTGAVARWVLLPVSA